MTLPSGGRWVISTMTTHPVTGGRIPTAVLAGNSGGAYFPPADIVSGVLLNRCLMHVNSDTVIPATGVIIVPDRQPTDVVRGAALTTLRNWVSNYFSASYRFRHSDLTEEDMPGLTDINVPDGVTYGQAIRRLVRYLAHNE